MSIGETSHFAPDYGKAKSAANRLFFLLDRIPAIDNFSTEGKKPVSAAQAESSSNYDIVFFHLFFH